LLHFTLTSLLARSLRAGTYFVLQALRQLGLKLLKFYLFIVGEIKWRFSKSGAFFNPLKLNIYKNLQVTSKNRNSYIFIIA